MKILLLETNEIFPLLIKKYLLNDGESNLVTCTSAAAALEIARYYLPHLLIMDLGPRDGDGISMLRALKGLDGEIYVLVLLGMEDYDRLDEALALGVDDYAVKPVTDHEFTARVKKAMAFVQRSGALREKREAAPSPSAPDSGGNVLSRIELSYRPRSAIPSLEQLRAEQKTK